MDPSLNTEPNLSEETVLIDFVVSGQTSKFDVLVGTYQQRIYSTLLGMLGNRQDAEDVTQETFLTAFRKLDQFERRSSFYTWLHRIAFNAAIDLQRRKKRTKNQIVNSEAIDAIEPAGQQANSPESIVMVNETVNQVQLAMSRLDADRRNIIVLRDLQGIDYAEIASMLDIPVGTVRSRLHRARIELRDIMNAMGIGLSDTNPSPGTVVSHHRMVTPGRDQL
jgi:RNA polymerase sigma-70 factor (ECF subfamily)